jgi:hypothetical protein
MEVSAMPRLSRKGRLWGVASITALALLGLVVAAAISLAASRLSSQHIGISSEPLSAGKSLSPVDDGRSQKKPQHQTRTRGQHRRHGSGTQTQTTPAPPPAQGTPPAQLTPPAQITPAPPASTTPRPGGDDYHRDDSGARGGEDD